jgi:23S rRNA (guanine745-N1)-methyltransferase
VLGCDAGHRFDVNRRGYASLLSGSTKLIGDSAAMLDARDAFLEKGWYTELRDALSRLVGAGRPRRVVDIGCGTGYYLRGVLSVLEQAGTADGSSAEAELRALAVDLSPVAVARTLRTATIRAEPAGSDSVAADTAGLVADVWSPLPIRDAAADVIINVFAPRNATEFHRILTPDGLLAVVVPHTTHLQELRAAGLALDVHANKVDGLVDSLSGGFRLESADDISRVLSLSPTDVGALIGMGPSSHHSGSPASVAAPAPTDVTVAFSLLGFRRTGA